MTTVRTQAAPGTDEDAGAAGSVEADGHPGANAVATEITALTDLLARFKASVHNATDGDADWLGNRLLLTVLAHRPMRASELADHTRADPSTISRQVANLVREGLVERRADPRDGRAVLLHATEAGFELRRLQLASRDEHYARLLADWNLADQHTLAHLLARFSESFDRYQATLLADLTDRSAATVGNSARPADESQVQRGLRGTP